jgi:RNA polymerase primary sigma factor
MDLREFISLCEKEGELKRIKAEKDAMSLIGVDQEYPIEETGQGFNVSRERITQIEAKASRSLKHFSRDRKLQSFIEH